MNRHMQTSIKALIPTKKTYKVVTLFGYSSKGVPGIELIGLGKHSRTLREKLVYLCRKRGIKFPVKRFVICVDTNEEVSRMNYDELQWLEFPFFLLLLNFLELLPMSRLDNCLSFGKINADGELTQLSVNEKVFDYCRVSKLSMIHHECHMDRVIDTKELLRDIPALRWRESLPG
jgi:hypothetical protein